MSEFVAKHYNVATGEIIHEKRDETYKVATRKVHMMARNYVDLIFAAEQQNFSTFILKWVKTDENGRKIAYYGFSSKEESWWSIYR